MHFTDGIIEAQHLCGYNFLSSLESVSDRIKNLRLLITFFVSGDLYKAIFHLHEAVWNGLPIFYNLLKGCHSSDSKQMFSFHREQDKREYILIGDRRNMDCMLELPDNRILDNCQGWLWNIVPKDLITTFLGWCRYRFV